MSRTDAAKIAGLLADYLRERRQLVALVMLIDARRGPEREELDLAASVHERGLELIVVATKSDKIRNAERPEIPRRFAALAMPPIMCSTGSRNVSTTCRRFPSVGLFRRNSLLSASATIDKCSLVRIA